MSTQAVLQLPWLFCIFCLLIFVEFVLVFGWLGLAPEICTGGSGGGDICVSFFLWLLLGVKGELVVPDADAVSGGSAWGLWGDCGRCCFSRVSIACHSAGSQRLNPKRWTKTSSSAWFVPHASALSASLIMQS